MVARLLLFISSLFGALIGIGFIVSGVYIGTQSNLAATLTASIDLSAVPTVEALKKDIVEKFDNSGVIATVGHVVLVTGVIVATISALGLASAITGWKVVVIAYIVFSLLLLLGVFAILLLLTGMSSLIEKPLVDKLVAMQDDKLVSIVALLNNNAGDGVIATIFVNAVQLKLACCGMRTVGDTRDSPSWQASPRGLADLLDMRAGSVGGGGSGGGGGSVSSLLLSDDIIKSGGVPDWLRNRIPPGATLPPDVDLPDALPKGLRVPSQFNITSDILNDVKAIRKLLEESLVLKTPISCCKFASTDALLNFDVKYIVASLEDPDCPFRADNGPGVNSETCYTKAFNMIKGFTIPIIISGIVVGFMLTCNLSFAIKILVCG